MRKSRTLLLIAATLTALVPAAATAAVPGKAPVSTATAPAPPPITVAVLSRGSVADPFVAKTNGIKLAAHQPMDVAIAHLTFQVGANSGWHRHLGPAVVTVMVGSLTTIDHNCKRHTYTVGQSFVEAGSRHAAMNTGETVAETNVTFFVPAGATALSTPADPPRRCRS